MRGGGGNQPQAAPAPAPQPAAAAPVQQQAPDYSAQWAEYYRSVGKL